MDKLVGHENILECSLTPWRVDRCVNMCVWCFFIKKKKKKRWKQLSWGSFWKLQQSYGGCFLSQTCRCQFRETSWKLVWKYGTTVKHQDALSPHDTLLFISPPPSRFREPSLAAWQRPLPHAKQQSAGARAPDRSPSWSLPPNMLSWPALGTAKWFCSCPFVPLP